MKRTLTAFFLCFLMLLSLPLRVSAAYPPLMDPADLLSDEDHNALQNQCLSFREEYGMDVAICITDSLNGSSAQAFADDWYDSHNYSEDGLLFLLAMEEREWHISTSGDAIVMLTDYDLAQIEDMVIPYLSDGLYYEGFSHFLAILPQFLEEETPVDIYYDDQGNLHAVYEEESGANLLLSLLIGAVAASISLLVMRSAMNTKNPQRSADSYEVPDSYRLHSHQDLFLYSNLARIRRQEPSKSGGGSTVHRSSSGRSHGGRGGKF